MPEDVAQPAEPRRDPESRSTGRSSGSGPKPRLEGDRLPSLDDPRVVQILGMEHTSLLSARSLAYNEAFTRGGMFLAFLSFSFVGLALVAQALPINRDFLLVTALILAFDLVVGLTTFGRIIGTSYEDYLAVHGMARIRHAYGEIAPVVLPYFTTSIHDDLRGVMVSYGNPPTRGLGALVYQLTTSGGMMALVVALIGAVLGLVVALLLGASLGMALGVGGAAGLAILFVLAALTFRFYSRVQANLHVAFPTPPDAEVPASNPDDRLTR